MSNLSLVYSSEKPTNILYTDSLILSVFSFIADSCLEDQNLGSIYYTSLDLFEKIVENGYLPTSYVYMPNLDLWGRKVTNSNLINRLQIDFDISIQNKLKGLNNLIRELEFPEESEVEVAHLNLQETLDYSSYLLFESFLNYLDDDNDNPVIYPQLLRILNNNNLDDEIKNLFKIKNKIRFSGNGDIGFMN